MKKIAAIILILSLCFALAGCPEVETEPSKEDYTDNGNVSNDRASDSKKQTFGLLETAVFDDLKFTALEVKESEGTKYFKPEEGQIYIGVKFEIENISDEEQSISSILLFDAYVDDIKASQSLTAASDFAEGTIDGTVASGKKLVGWYVVEASENWSEMEIDVKADWLSNTNASFVFTK